MMMPKKKTTKKRAVKKSIGVVLGTGPSLTKDQLDYVYQSQQAGKCKVYGVNHAWRDFPTLDVFMACNYEYYNYYWEHGLKNIPAAKWTWHLETSKRYGINYIEGKWEEGFSKDPNYLHFGHSSGFQIAGLAYRDKIKKMILLGYDMCFAPDYNGRNRQIGNKPRHYFGEYPEQLQHWPSVKIQRGVFTELIQHFERVSEINTDVEIINCSPDSAMTCFPMMKLEDAI